MNKDRCKNEILTKLLTIEGQVGDNAWKAWIRQTIDFIKESK